MNLKLLYQWSEELANYLPSLNSWQVANVALFSLGVIRAQHCQQEALARQVSCGEKVASTTRRWRRFLANVHFPLASFFREWTAWLVGRCDASTIYLLVDETKLQDRFGIMMLGLAWEGRCMPLAWRCYRANSAAHYPTEGQVGMITALLETIAPAIPTHKKVIVMADRGIGPSPRLCQNIEALGWHYLFRVTCQSKICTAQGDYTIAQMVQPGQFWTAEGLIFKQRGRIPAQARAIWSQGYDQPWALVTNDPQATGFEYARRNWQEQAFRDLKSYGWQWQVSHIRKPDHLERLLVVLAVAYAWLIAIGCYAIHLGQAQPLSRQANGNLRRHWSVFREGLQWFTEYVERQTICLTLCFVPDKRFT